MEQFAFDRKKPDFNVLRRGLRHLVILENVRFELKSQSAMIQCG